MYKKYFKRILDFCIACVGLIVLSPVFLILTIAGAIAMKGNPFFVQNRPGKIDIKTGQERIFPLIKFRTMSNEKDKTGKLLSDSERLNSYGRALRASSLDELPELVNILLGHLSCVGPRPLACQYLPYFNDVERQRHTVRPGLTGLAQINRRNSINWPERFAYDVEYVHNISFKNDLDICIKTIFKVLKREKVAIRGTTNIMDFDKFRKMEIEEQQENGEKPYDRVESPSSRNIT